MSHRRHRADILTRLKDLELAHHIAFSVAGLAIAAPIFSLVENIHLTSDNQRKALTHLPLSTDKIAARDLFEAPALHDLEGTIF